MHSFDANTVSTEQAAEILTGKILKTMELGGGSLRWVEDTAGQVCVLGAIDISGSYFRLDAPGRMQ